MNGNIIAQGLGNGRVVTQGLTAATPPGPAPDPHVTRWGSGGYLGFVCPDFDEAQLLVVRFWDGEECHHELVCATEDEQFIGPAIEWAQVMFWQEVRI